MTWLYFFAFCKSGIILGNKELEWRTEGHFFRNKENNHSGSNHEEVCLGASLRECFNSFFPLLGVSVVWFKFVFSNLNTFQ